MLTTGLLVSALTASVSAYNFSYLPELAIGGPAIEYNTTNFIEAEQSPLAFGVLNFTLFDQPGWTWRINVSEVALNSTQQASVNVANATAYVTSYDIQWPTGGNLTNGLNNLDPSLVPANNSFCAAALGSFVTSSTAKAWKNGNGADCTSALGSDCVNAITSSNQWTSTPGKCSSAFINNLAACKSKFPTDYEMVSWSLAFEPTFLSSTNRTLEPVQSGSGIFYDYSPLYSGSNDTWLKQEQDRLHLMILYDGSKSQVLCGKTTSAGTGLADILGGGLSRVWLSAAMVVLLVAAF